MTALRSKCLLVILSGSALLTTACGRLEEANAGKGYAGKADTHASSSGGGQFTAGSYKAGDKTSWQESLDVRAKAQNEYARTPPRDSAK